MPRKPRENKALSLPTIQASPGVRVPKCRLHKASGQAVVTLSGRDVYLGKYGSGETAAATNRLRTTSVVRFAFINTFSLAPLATDLGIRLTHDADNRASRRPSSTATSVFLVTENQCHGKAMRSARRRGVRDSLCGM